MSNSTGQDKERNGKQTILSNIKGSKLASQNGEDEEVEHDEYSLTLKPSQEASLSFIGVIQKNLKGDDELKPPAMAVKPFIGNKYSISMCGEARTLKPGAEQASSETP